MSLLPEAVIIDLDSTLVQTPPPPNKPYDQVDWDQVVSDNSRCLPDPAISALTRVLLSSGKHVIFMTGRSSTKTQKEATMRWLITHSFWSGNQTHLFMRTPGDWREDSLIKFDLTKDNVLNKFKVLFVVDDRPSNISMWQNEFSYPAILYTAV